MFKNNRNIEGLKRSAAERHRQAVQRAEKAIMLLMREERPVNFKAVAETASVSTAWLYGQPELRERIEQLRHQGTQRVVIRNHHRASDGSKEAIIHALKARVKSLEQKNQELERRLEIAYGRLCEQGTH